MFNNKYSSKLLESAVEEFATLPGIGKKSALRMALHLLKQPKENIEKFGNSFINLRRDVKYCSICNMISDDDVCAICSNPKRDLSTICVVESIRDVLSIENTDHYNGLYHVLGGSIYPRDGVGPSELKIKELIERLSNKNIKEVILTLSTSMLVEIHSFFIYT